MGSAEGQSPSAGGIGGVPQISPFSPKTGGYRGLKRELINALTVKPLKSGFAKPQGLY
jgi:hypothetical protein